MESKTQIIKNHYKKLESTGIDIIQSDVIKNSIINIYNSDYQGIEGAVENHLRNNQALNI